MLLILNGLVFLWTGGAPTGALADNFREFGREGITGVPWIEELPYSVIVLVAVAGIAAWLARGGFGRRVLAVGDNDRAAALSGISVTRVRTAAFILSATSAIIAAILLGGFAGVTAQVGQGLEFQAITAAVLGGTVLGGGRGSVLGAVGGALVLQALFELLNQYSVESAVEQTVTGLLIIAAVSVAAFRTRGS
jgi:ribose transport system permease protein